MAKKSKTKKKAAKKVSKKKAAKKLASQPTMGELGSKALAGKKVKVPPADGETLRNVTSGNNSINITEALYDRCSKKIGMTNAQIASYKDEAALKQAANGMHPKSNPDARVKQGKTPVPVKFPEMLKDVFTLESALEAKFIKSNRDHFDNNNLRAFLRSINRRYGPQEPVRIVKDQSNIVVKRELVTTFTIYFK